MEQLKSKKVLRKKKTMKKKALDEDVERLKMEREEEDKEKMLLINSIVTKCNLSEEKVMIFKLTKTKFHITTISSRNKNAILFDRSWIYMTSSTFIFLTEKSLWKSSWR